MRANNYIPLLLLFSFTLITRLTQLLAALMPYRRLYESFAYLPLSFLFRPLMSFISQIHALNYTLVQHIYLLRLDTMTSAAPAL